MAIPGIGFRTANDLLEEISLHLVEPYVSTTLTAPVTPGNQTVMVGSVASMYDGAQLVVDTGTNAEIITLTAIGAATITAVFANSHASGSPVSAATWPIQQATDPIYTQSEMLTYLSRAQNEFLSAVPITFALFAQTSLTGTVYQPLPTTAIELNRVATSEVSLPVSTLVRSADVVTATFASPHGLAKGSTFWLKSPVDLSFVGAFQIATVPSPTTLTYTQVATNASTTGGTVMYLSRLYEITQEEQTMANRQWQQGLTGSPTAFFEDRSGLYRWGMNAQLPYQIPVELLCGIRDTDSLTLLDHFLIPDVMIHGVKYLALSYIFSKDGVWHDSQRADFCIERYKRIIAATGRYLDGMGIRLQGNS